MINLFEKQWKNLLKILPGKPQSFLVLLIDKDLPAVQYTEKNKIAL